MPPLGTPDTGHCDCRTGKRVLYCGMEAPRVLGMLSDCPLHFPHGGGGWGGQCCRAHQLPVGTPGRRVGCGIYLVPMYHKEAWLLLVRDLQLVADRSHAAHKGLTCSSQASTQPLLQLQKQPGFLGSPSLLPDLTTGGWMVCSAACGVGGAHSWRVEGETGSLLLWHWGVWLVLVRPAGLAAPGYLEVGQPCFK